MKKALLLLLIALPFTVFCACSGGGQSEGAEAANPTTLYASQDDLQRSVGFSVPLPENLEDYASLTYASIGGVVGQVTLATGDGEATIRKAEGEEDISGVYNAQGDGATEFGGVEIRFSQYEDTRVAQWTSDGFSYSVTARALDEADFDALVNEITAQTIVPADSDRSFWDRLFTSDEVEGPAEEIS